MSSCTAKRESGSRRPRKANGEGSIVERSDGRFQFSLRVGKDEDGRSRRCFLLAPTRAELVRKVQDERARNGGTLQPPVNMTVATLVERYLAERNPFNAPERKGKRKPEDGDRSEISASTYESWSRAYRQVKPYIEKRPDCIHRKRCSNNSRGATQRA